MILATLVTSTELSIRQEQIDVVATNVVLREIDNGHHQTLFAVVISCFLGYVANELGDLSSANSVQYNYIHKDECQTNLDFTLQLTLEAAPDDFPLARFEAIDD